MQVSVNKKICIVVTVLMLMSLFVPLAQITSANDATPTAEQLPDPAEHISDAESPLETPTDPETSVGSAPTVAESTTEEGEGQELAQSTATEVVTTPVGAPIAGSPTVDANRVSPLEVAQLSVVVSGGPLIADGSAGPSSVSELPGIGQLSVEINGGVPPYISSPTFESIGGTVDIVGQSLVFAPHVGYEGPAAIEMVTSDSSEPPLQAQWEFPLLVVNNADPMVADQPETLITYSERLANGQITVAGGQRDKTFQVSDEPELGTVSLSDANSGRFTYLPHSGGLGWDSFTVSVSDNGYAPTGNSEDPYGPRVVEVTVDVLIRPAVAIESLECDGTITYTIPSGEWGSIEESIHFSITSPGPVRDQVRGGAVAQYGGPGTFTIETDLRPADYLELTASSNMAANTVTISNCYPGGNPDLEPELSIDFHGLTCDGTVTYTVIDGQYIPDDWTIMISGQNLSDGEIVDSAELGNGAAPLSPGTHLIEMELQWFEFDFDRYFVRIGTIEGAGQLLGWDYFDTCVDDFTTEQPVRATLLLCGNEECNEPHTTGADGYTATWTITREPLASNPIVMAFRQEPPAMWTVTAAVENGIATGFSQPLPTGATYRVCLNPILEGPDGSTIRIANAEACNAVTLTGMGDPDESGTEFETVVIGQPEVTPPTGSMPLDQLIQLIIRIILDILGRIGGTGNVEFA